MQIDLTQKLRSESMFGCQIVFHEDLLYGMLALAAGTFLDGDNLDHYVIKRLYEFNYILSELEY